MRTNTVGDISGQIAGVALSSFLQMIEMEQKTCTIRVFTKKNLGQIYFFNGALVDANTIHLKHLDALYDILSWENSVIEIDKNDAKKQNAINLPLMHVLMESARYADETGKTALPDATENSDAAAKTLPLQVMKNKEFCLEIGIKLLIEFDHLAVSFRSTLVGIEHGKYLLLKAPSPFDKTDHDLIIKSLYKGTIYAFRSKLIDIISRPSKLMFIEYPSKIEHHELRSYKRFKCSIVAQTAVKEKERNGVIENISIGGCLCVIEAFSTDMDVPASLLRQIVPLRCHFPGSKGEVSFVGEIKNARKNPTEFMIGIQFVYPDSPPEVRKIIHDYIQVIECSSEKV